MGCQKVLIGSSIPVTLGISSLYFVSNLPATKHMARKKMSEEERRRKRREAERRRRDSRNDNEEIREEDRLKRRLSYEEAKKKKTIKMISDMSPQEKRRTRENWRKSRKRYYWRQKMENSAQSDSLPQTLTNADGPEDSTPNIMNNNLEPLATQNYQRQMWNADTSNAELNSETASKIWKSLLIGQNPDTLQMDKVPRRGDAEMKILAKRAREKARYERNKSDPAKAMLMKSRYHANYLKRKENYIPFSQRTEVEKRILRKVWRENKRASRLNKASANLKMTLTHEELDGAEKSFKSDASICLSSDQGSLGSTRGNSPHESSLTQQPNTNDASFLNMDVARLIQKVKEREPLWDRKHVYYHDRTMTMSLWEEVAYSLNVDSETARAKWKGLRDTFRGELRKLHKTMVAGKPRTSTNWEYFDKMLFVKDQIYSYQRHHEEIKKRRKLLETQSQLCTTDDSTLSGSPPEEIVIHPTVKVEPFDPIDDYVEPEVDESLCSEEPTSTAAERVKGSIKKTIDDDDFNFLMSLLPQMKCLPMTRNLFVRLKIQELLYNEIVAAGQTVQSTS